MNVEQLQKRYTGAIKAQIDKCNVRIDAELKELEASGSKARVIVDYYNGMKQGLNAALNELDYCIALQAEMER